MKSKTFLALTAAVLLISPASAQAQVIEKGNVVAQVAIGVGTLYDYGWRTNTKFSIPPLSLAVEYCILDGLIDDKAAVSVGGYLGHYARRYEYGTGYGWRYSHTITGARGAFHFQFVDKLDTYAGIMLGYRFYHSGYYGDWGTTSRYDYGGSSAFEHSEFVGARYYFTDFMAVFAEVGYGGISILQGGLAFKF